jgi:dihydropteroate synthase
VSAEDEIARLAPVALEVVRMAPVSIDTMKASVARWALDRGAVIVNDVWGLQRDPDMAHVVADHGAVVVVMHNRTSADPAIDIMADISASFERSLAIAARAGVGLRRIVLDPGIGFGKTPTQSVEVLARLGELTRFGLPLLVGASRKRFIDALSPAPPERRLGGSLAAHLAAVGAGAAIVRAHDVVETVQALAIDNAIREARCST